MPETNDQNPLLHLQFRIPFDGIRAGHVQPAIGQLLRESRARIDGLAAHPEPLSYDHILEALDTVTELILQALAAVPDPAPVPAPRVTAVGQ